LGLQFWTGHANRFTAAEKISGGHGHKMALPQNASLTFQLDRDNSINASVSIPLAGPPNKSPVKTIARAMKRTPGALRQKAFALGVSLGHRRWSVGAILIEE